MFDYALQSQWKVKMVSLTNPRYWLDEINPIFHGRDVFAPVAGHLANGIQIDDFGPQMDDPVIIS
jgi:S-adenosylmethionine hydrolase